MARLFDNADNQELVNDTGAPVTSTPLTMACWFRSDEQDTRQCLISLADVSASTEEFRMELLGDLGGKFVSATTRSSGGSDAIGTTTGFTVDVWHHACTIFTSDTLRATFIDGGSKDTSTVNSTPTGIDGITIGRTGDTTPASPMSGRVAEAAIWNAALIDAEVAALASGILPYHIRPANLVAYWPLHGLISPEPDYTSNAVGLTLVGDSGSPTLADHAPVVPFSSKFWGDTPLIGTAAGPVGVLARGVIPFNR